MSKILEENKNKKRKEKKKGRKIKERKIWCRKQFNLIVFVFAVNFFGFISKERSIQKIEEKKKFK